MIDMDNTIRKLIHEYHRYQGDTGIGIVRKLVTSKGEDLYLVRMHNRAGDAYSAVDTIAYDGKGRASVVELCSTMRDGDDGMVADMMEVADK